MSSALSQHSDQEFEELVRPVWNFLVVRDEPAPADIIIILGTLLSGIERHAADLWQSGFAPKIMTVGGIFGHDLSDLTPIAERTQPESLIAQQRLLSFGVPAEQIIMESESSNTGENIERALPTLQEHGITPHKVILVSKPWHSRRCRATWRRWYPDIPVLSCPPAWGMLESLDRPREHLAKSLVEEVFRIQDYPRRGFIIADDIPSEVLATAEKIKQLLK